MLDVSYTLLWVCLKRCLCRAIYLLSMCVCRRVEEVVRFPGLPPRRQLTYQAKQTISREMEQEKMRRAEQLMLQRNPAVVRQIIDLLNIVQPVDNQVIVCVNKLMYL